MSIQPQEKTQSKYLPHCHVPRSPVSLELFVHVMALIAQIGIRLDAIGAGQGRRDGDRVGTRRARFRTLRFLGHLSPQSVLCALEAGGNFWRNAKPPFLVLRFGELCAYLPIRSGARAGTAAGA